eukprot:289975_1
MSHIHTFMVSCFAILISSTCAYYNYDEEQKTQHIHADVRSELYSNMVMAGPGTLFPGIGDRIHREMASLVPTRTIMVVEPPERAYSVWMGASLHAVYFADSIAWIYRE